MDAEPNPKHAAGGGDGGEPERWLDREGSVDTIVRALVAVSALTVIADFFYHKHGHWHFQEWIGFDAAYGFVACVGLVIAAKGLRVLLMRDENFYGDRDDEADAPGGTGHD